MVKIGILGDECAAIGDKQADAEVSKEPTESGNAGP